MKIFLNLKYVLLIAVTAAALAACGSQSTSGRDLSAEITEPYGETQMREKVIKTDEEWKESLSPEQYHVLRHSGTERAFTGRFNDHTEEGLYVCAGCGTPLFSSVTKYDHGTGWPSFTAAVDERHIERRPDHSLLMKRTEVRCAVCDGHLGHVFDDGPPPTHVHYCINSAALDFKPEKNEVVKSEKEFEGVSQDVPAAVNGTRTAESGDGSETAVFAAGCFWGIEHKFGQVRGVISTRVGYTGGHVKKPTYEQVCSDITGHAEAVEIKFDPALVSYPELLDVFFRIHDPTQIDRQGPDIGKQYRSAIFYLNESQKQAAERAIAEWDRSERFSRPIATQLIPAEEFYQAEDYHQKYYEKIYKKR